MADVTVSQVVILKISDEEWRLIMRSLALYAGLKINTKPQDRQRAAVLNQQLLRQRVSTLQDQLEAAEGALEKAVQPESEPHVISLEEPTPENDPVGRFR